MAKMSFKSDNKANDAASFPKLKLDQDETARIVLFEEPEAGYVHNLRAPKMVNGEVQYQTVQTKNGPDRQMVFDFIGNPICMGNESVLADRGIDPNNCPACAAAKNEPDMFQAPKRRFAVHVFQYATNGTNKPTKNFQGAVKVWAFTDQKFGELVDILEEAPDGDMTKIDLILGPCENKLFQKFKIIHSNQVKYRESEASMAAFEEIISENRAKDLSLFLGRPVKKKEYLEDDLDKVRVRWKAVNGQSGEKANDGLAEAERGGLEAGLAGLLDEPAKPEVSVAAGKDSASVTSTSSEAPDLDELLASLDD